MPSLCSLQSRRTPLSLFFFSLSLSPSLSLSLPFSLSLSLSLPRTDVSECVVGEGEGGESELTVRKNPRDVIRQTVQMAAVQKNLNKK